MPEQVTVIITETTPGGGSRFYQEPGHPSSVDVDSLTPNTEYRADAEYEAPDGTTIQASNSMTFRTLPVGMFSISNPNWQNDNDGQHSTFTFDYTSTYALSYAQVVDMATGVTYQGTIVGSSVTAQLPAGTAGTQHNFQLIIADIYGYDYVQGYVMTLQASMAETPFYIEAENPSDAPQISLTKYESPASLTMLISYNNSTWSNYTIGDPIILNSSHPRVYFKNSSSSRFSLGPSNYYHFTADDYVNVGGNIASLRKNDLRSSVSYEYDFCFLFFNNTYLKKADKLYLGNYTRLADSCYVNMFRGCTSLITVPSLPATTLANGCYSLMFDSCSSLSSVPADLLPVTTLANSCYEYMFFGCTSLTTTPTLPATTMANYCYKGMFLGCTSLTTIPSELLPATTLADDCYIQMFQGCTGLTTLPSRLLPATTLTTYCYSQMFKNCTGLTSIPSELLPATTLASSCYREMFNGCTSLKNAPELPAETLESACYYQMFIGCTSLKNAPELPARTLVSSCYREMFNGCSSLEYIKIGATSWSTSYARDWVSGVANSGNFEKPSGTSMGTGTSSIPSGWTVVDYRN